MKCDAEIVRKSEARAPVAEIDFVDSVAAEVFLGDDASATSKSRAKLGERSGAGARILSDEKKALIAGPVRPRMPRPASPLRVKHLSFAGATPSTTEYERTIGTNDLVDEFYLERALVAARPVCRIVIRNAAGREEGYATGVMIAPHVLLTNWHVFRTADEAQNSIAEFDYKLDIKGDPQPSVRFRIRPGNFYHSNREFDYAVLAVEAQSIEGNTALSAFGFHRLVAEENKIQPGEWVTIIQHPGGLRRQFAIRENELLRIQDPFLWYKSDTAQGSSGSPAFNDSFQIVALHHSGKAKQEGQKYVLKDGRRVDSLDGIDESLVIWEANEGLRISRLCADLVAALPANNPFSQEISTAMRGGDIMSRTLGSTESAIVARPENVVAPIRKPGLNGAEATMLINVERVDIAQVVINPPPVAAPEFLVNQNPRVDATPTAALTEKMVTPIIDSDYTNREGYDPDFLGVAVPLPEPTKPGSVAKMDDGSFVIPYEHFSIVMHKKRRLALYTASNVTGSPSKRRPGAGDFSRKGLSGLGKNDIEKWLTDPRIPEQQQLPDVFFTKDRASFDRGHIVRRDDVCWGKNRAQIVRANGDTFHTTNCSPQVSGFNQGQRGEDNWGDLEDNILKQAKTEAYCLFAGPVLADDDEWFEGVDERGPVRIQIPQRYWKIVVARNGGGLQSFGFVLEQDLSAVPFEFAVDATWRPYMVSLKELQKTLGEVKFPQAVIDADQFAQGGGESLMRTTGIERMSASAPGNSKPK